MFSANNRACKRVPPTEKIRYYCCGIFSDFGLHATGRRERRVRRFKLSPGGVGTFASYTTRASRLRYRRVYICKM